MKEEYQIEKQGAEVEAQQSPQANELPVQITLPMTEVLSCIEQGLGELVARSAGYSLSRFWRAEAEQIAVPDHAAARLYLLDGSKRCAPLWCGMRARLHSFSAVRCTS